MYLSTIFTYVFTTLVSNDTMSNIATKMGGNLEFNESSLDCPEFGEDYFKMAEEFSFWVEGVFQTIVGILGIFGNIVAGFILSRREMRNSFNLLLVTLACFDSTYVSNNITMYQQTSLLRCQKCIKAHILC